jgi:hypothetical protein
MIYLIDFQISHSSADITRCHPCFKHSNLDTSSSANPSFPSQIANILQILRPPPQLCHSVRTSFQTVFSVDLCSGPRTFSLLATCMFEGLCEARLSRGRSNVSANCSGRGVGSRAGAQVDTEYSRQLWACVRQTR